MLCFTFLLVRRQHEPEGRTILSFVAVVGSPELKDLSVTAGNPIGHGREAARAKPLCLVVNKVIVMLVTYLSLLCTTVSPTCIISYPSKVLKERWT